MATIPQKSEIAGTIWKIEVEPGQIVSEGETLILIESMKMEIPLFASQSGKVEEILVKEQETISEGQPLAMLGT